MIAPTAILYGLMIAKAAQNVQDEQEKQREETRKERDAYWRDFHDNMDRTFKRGKYGR